MVLPEYLLIINIISTIFMTGVIWVVQLIVYPSFKKIPIEGFAKYHSRHTRNIGSIVIIPMLCELITAGWLLKSSPLQIPQSWLTLGFFIVSVVWLVTLFCSIPAHNRLKKGFTSKAHSYLISTNWIRTCGWSLRLILIMACLYKMF